MAFYRDPMKEQEDENESGVESTSPGSAMISGQNGATGAQKAGGSQDRSSSFAGIHQYLEANKNQGAKLGDQTAGIINQSAQDARTRVGELQSEADRVIKPVQALSDDVKSKIAGSAESLSAQERQQVKNTASARYTGPANETGFGDIYTNAQKATQKATENINNADTEQGRMNLVTQINSRPRTSGMNVFDNALLQAGGGREKIAQAANQNQGVKSALDQTSQAIRNRIGRADDLNTKDIDESSGVIGATDKAQADAYKSVQDALNVWKQGFQPKVGQAQQSLIDQQNRVARDLGDNPFGLDQETLDLFGLSEGQRVFDADLATYLKSVNPGDINAANVATAEDYARYSALADLAGERDLMLRPEDAAKAGTAPRFGVDQERLQKDLAAKQAAFDDLARQTTLASTQRAGDEDWATASGTVNLLDYLTRGDQAIAVGPAKYWSSGMSIISDAGAQAESAAKSDLARQIKSWLEANGYNQVLKKNS